MFLLQEKAVGSSVWTTVGEPYPSPLAANGQRGSLLARHPGKQFRVIPVPVKPSAPTRNNPNIGAIVARLWLDGKDLAEIDNHVSRLLARLSLKVAA